MANPSSPTATNLVYEAHRRCGIHNPDTDQVQKGTDEIMEEIKKFIGQTRSWKMLEKSFVTNISQYVRNYALPSDYNYMETLRMYSGNSGTSQAVSATSITLAAGEALTQAQALGSIVFITDGSASGSYGRITAYSTSTKVATVTAFAPSTPSGTPTYLVATGEVELEPIVEERVTLFDTVGTVSRYKTLESVLVLSPIPSTANRVLVGWYQIRVDRVDLAGTTIVTLYEKWHTALIKGLMWGIYQTSGSERVSVAKEEFVEAVKLLVEEENRRI